MEVASLAPPSRLRGMLSPACSPRAISAIARAGQAAFSQYHAILGSPLATATHTGHCAHARHVDEPASLARRLTWATTLHRRESRQRAKSGGASHPDDPPEQKLACRVPAGSPSATPPAARHECVPSVCAYVIRTRHAIAETIARLKPARKSKVAAWRSVLALCVAAALVGEAGVRAVQAGIHGVAWSTPGAGAQGAATGGQGGAVGRPARSLGMSVDVNIQAGTPHAIIAVNLQDVQLQPGTGICASVQSAPVHSEYLSQFSASEHTSACASPEQVQRAQLPAAAASPFSGMHGLAMPGAGPGQQLTFVVEGLKPGAYRVSLVSMSAGWKRTTLSSTFRVPLRVLEYSAGRLVPPLRVTVLA